MQSRNPFIDDLARVSQYAADAACAAGKEARSALNGAAEEMVSRLDLVRREELDSVEDRLGDAVKAIAALESRVSALEDAAAKSPARARRKPDATGEAG